MDKFMKILKYLSVLILLIVTGLPFVANKVFAQNTFASLFNTQHIVIEQKITVASTHVDQPVLLFPYTNLLVKKGSFTSDVDLFVYAGNFNNIKSLLPNGQSSLSSYYLVFRNSAGIKVLPSVPVNITVNDNFSNTNMYFNPINGAGNFDTAKVQNWKGPTTGIVDLPVSDPAFVFAVNKNLDPNGAELNPTVIPTQPAAVANIPVVIQNNGSSQSALLPIIILLLVVVCAIFVVVLVRNNKKRQ